MLDLTSDFSGMVQTSVCLILMCLASLPYNALAARISTDLSHGKSQSANDSSCDCLDKEAYLKTLIEELANDASLQTYAQSQSELLRRVDVEKLFGAEGSPERQLYDKVEDSVFERVEQHKLNGEAKLNLFAEQFLKAHGLDHKSYTEKWLSDQTGEDIQLETVLQNPTFSDLVGVYDIRPFGAYVATKMIIDGDDFMGIFNLSSTTRRDLHDTYEGVPETPNATTRALSDEAIGAPVRRAGIPQEVRPLEMGSGESASQGCGCSDKLVKPHALGDGEFLQFKLRYENVKRYMDDSMVSFHLKQLIPDDPKEPIYVFTASANGVMRFHPWGAVPRKLWHGYGDSESVTAFPLNIKHAAQYGCFCFGVIYKERKHYKDSKGNLRKGGRTIVMRYNRWATDNAPIYAMMRQHPDAQDKRVPASLNSCAAAVPGSESRNSAYLKWFSGRVCKCRRGMTLTGVASECTGRKFNPKLLEDKRCECLVDSMVS